MVLWHNDEFFTVSRRNRDARREGSCHVWVGTKGERVEAFATHYPHSQAFPGFPTTSAPRPLTPSETSSCIKAGVGRYWPSNSSANAKTDNKNRRDRNKLIIAALSAYCLDKRIVLGPKFKNKRTVTTQSEHPLYNCTPMCGRTRGYNWTEIFGKNWAYKVQVNRETNNIGIQNLYCVNLRSVFPLRGKKTGLSTGFKMRY